jgi:hypothetical protein
MKLFIPFFFFSVLAPAQVVSVGIKGGMPLTDALPTYGVDYGNATYTNMVDTGRWTVGPTIEFRLNKRLSIEVDALYRGYRQLSSFVSGEFTIPGGASGAGGATYPATYISSLSKTKAWDVPLLLKYRFGTGRYRPFVDAGAIYSHTSTDTLASNSCLSEPDVCANGPYNQYYSTGLHSEFFSTGNTRGTAGAGVEFRIGKFKLSPEVRYSRNQASPRNSVTLLVGFTY